MKLQRKKVIPEANIQAEFYHVCRKLNIPIFLEYKIKGTNSKRGCRFDAVILDSYDNIICIIEFKARTKKNIKELLESNQSKRYLEFGVPLKYVTQETDINKFITEEINPLIIKKFY